MHKSILHYTTILLTVTFTLPVRGLPVKLFDPSIKNCLCSDQGILTGKRIASKSPLTINANLRQMIACFEETITFAVKPGQRRKTFGMQRAKEISTEIVEQATTNALGSSNASVSGFRHNL